MAYPPGMELHGKRWRVVKRIPTDVSSHYAPDTHFRASTEEPDKRKAGAILWALLAEREEEYQRVRDTGIRLKQTITHEEVSNLVALMVRSSLGADEEGRDAGDLATDEGYAAFLRQMNSLEEETREALARRLFGGSLPLVVEDWLQGHGFNVPQDSAEFRSLCLEFAKGRSKALEVKRLRNEGQWVDTPPPPSASPVGVSAGALKLSAVVKHFMDKQDKQAPMFKKYQGATALLLEVLGDRPVVSLRQKEIDDFFSLLCRLPPRWKDKARQQQKTPVELAAMEWPECINTKTFEDGYMAALRPFFRDAARVFGDDGWPRTLTTEGIKYTGDRKGGGNRQRAMRQDELKRLFEGPEFAAFASDPAQEHCYWLPLLGLYTGARVNEVCQINPQCDIREEGGIWFLDITDTSETDSRVRKSVKNKPSRRQVPIHSVLLGLGFLDYARRMKEQGHALLFPQWPPTRGKASGKAEKWFGALLKDTGLRDETPGKRLAGFHCWRSTFLTRADHLDIHKPGTLTGHSQGETNRDEAVYKDAISLEKNRGKMELMAFEVSIPPRSR